MGRPPLGQRLGVEESPSISLDDLLHLKPFLEE
jgi:hypothetical protein